MFCVSSVPIHCRAVHTARTMRTSDVTGTGKCRSLTIQSMFWFFTYRKQNEPYGQQKNKHPCREVSSGLRTSGSFGATTHRLLLGQYSGPPVDYTSNMRLWLNAADTTSILNTTSGAITEGSLVGQCKDLSGNDNHAIMHNVSTAPT